MIRACAQREERKKRKRREREERGERDDRGRRGTILLALTMGCGPCRRGAALASQASAPASAPEGVDFIGPPPIACGG